MNTPAQKAAEKIACFLDDDLGAHLTQAGINHVVKIIESCLAEQPSASKSDRRRGCKPEISKRMKALWERRKANANFNKK